MAAIIRSSSQGSLHGAEAEREMPRSNSSGALRPSSAKRPSTTTLPSIVDPPPPPLATEKLDRGDGLVVLQTFGTEQDKQ
eukprot:g21821.t1